MKITFTTTKRWQAKLALDAEKWVFAIHEFDEWLRNRIKYHDTDELEAVRAELHEQLSDRGLSLDQTMCDMDS